MSNRVRIVEQIAAVQTEWDRGPISLAHEIREMLSSVVDHGTNIDSGGGDGIADLWATLQGIEYHISISRSKSQVEQDGS